MQILRIMKDSRIGTYALVGMLLVLHMKLHALAAFEATSVGAVLVAAHCASRWTSVPLLYCCKYIQVRTTSDRTPAAAAAASVLSMPRCPADSCIPKVPVTCLWLVGRGRRKEGALQLVRNVLS